MYTKSVWKLNENGVVWVAAETHPHHESTHAEDHAQHVHVVSGGVLTGRTRCTLRWRLVPANTNKCCQHPTNRVGIACILLHHTDIHEPYMYCLGCSYSGKH